MRARSLGDLRTLADQCLGDRFALETREELQSVSGCQLSLEQNQLHQEPLGETSIGS